MSFSFLLMTIFLRLTWLEKEHMADIIGNFLNENGQVLSQDQLIVLAKQIRQPMWEWHIYTGYVLVGLFSLRFLLPLFGKMKIQNPLERNLSAKEKFQKWTYIFFYIGVATSLITGLLIEFYPKAWKEITEEIHELSIYYLVAYIIIHISGVLIAEFTNQKGILSRIVSGKSISNKK
ncbi:MAG: cytochrome b/b6 domain-containing protein [Psychroflexus sp.]